MYSYTTFSILMLVVIFLAPRAAHAYLDPGTGSYIFQIVIASLLAALVSFKKLWFGVFGFFKRFKKTTSTEVQNNTKSSDQ